MYEPQYEEESGGGGFLIGLLCGTFAFSSARTAGVAATAPQRSGGSAELRRPGNDRPARHGWTAREQHRLQRPPEGRAPADPGPPRRRAARIDRCGAPRLGAPERTVGD